MVKKPKSTIKIAFMILRCWEAFKTLQLKYKLLLNSSKLSNFTGLKCPFLGGCLLTLQKMFKICPFNKIIANVTENNKYMRWLIRNEIPIFLFLFLFFYFMWNEISCWCIRKYKYASFEFNEWWYMYILFLSMKSDFLNENFHIGFCTE